MPCMKPVAMALVIVLGAASVGCASSRRETRVETRNRDGSTSVQRETTVVASENDGCSGVLSCTVDFAGDVVAFPFRLVGGLVSAIF